MKIQAIAPDLFRVSLDYVNVYFIRRTCGAWVLVDTGEEGRANAIVSAAITLFGSQSPTAILLTHGHFDHAGNAAILASQWNVPIYASRQELPFLTGELMYPAPDPSVGGFYGFVARYVTMRQQQLTGLIQELPIDLSEIVGEHWTCVATPGHTPGHISLFRAADRVLLAGDACLTIDFQSWIGTLTRWRRIAGPPAPYTLDWHAAIQSVQALAALQPTLIASGHGTPVSGVRATTELAQFAHDFTPPRRGRFVSHPLRYGTAIVPGTMPCNTK